MNFEENAMEIESLENSDEETIREMLEGILYYITISHVNLQATFQKNTCLTKISLQIMSVSLKINMIC